MTAPVAQPQAATPAPAPQSTAQPRQANEQSVKRFKALVEHDPEAPEPKTGPFEAQMPTKRRSDLSEQGGNPSGDKARPLTAPTPEAPPAPSDAGDRIAEMQKASELALSLDRANARPTATQLLLKGDALVAGGTIAQGSVPGVLDIAIHPGSQLLTADSLEALRRRLAAKGLTIGQLRLARDGEDGGSPPPV